MTRWTRRHFGQLLGSGAASLALPFYARAKGKPRVVIIGGGVGGATAARHIAQGSKGGIDVTLIDASDSYTTCIFSNLYLADYRDFASITHHYDRLQADYGITKITGMAAAVDRAGQNVVMADGAAIAYDRLIVAPGVDLIYDSIEGYSEEAAHIAPHAWKAGPQTQLLYDKLRALEDGQNIVMVAPPNPYRCPPAPYERVSMMAHVLKAKGFKQSKITILDPKDRFSKQALFEEGWSKYYHGMIEWYGPDVHGGIVAVDAAAGTVETDFDAFSCALLNVIPAQRAGKIAIDAGLADESGFCPIEAGSMRSALDDKIFVIGDAAIAGTMPKSGFSANSQAKVAAMHVQADLLSSQVTPAQYSNACWSLIETHDGIKVGADYAVVDGKIEATHSTLSQKGESDALRKATYEESVRWYADITADMFG